MAFEIAPADVPTLALGSAILACGGGGNPYYGRLLASRVLADRGPVAVIDVDEMPADALAVMCVGVGAPLIWLEKPPSLTALRAGFEAVRRSVGDRLAAFVAAEGGGAESVIPLLLAALTGRPMLDGDGMGRAFPEAQMCTFLIYGMTPGLPAAISDDHGLRWRFPALPTAFGKTHLGGTGGVGRVVGRVIERVLRSYCARRGGMIYLTATFDRPSLARTLVRGSVRLALNIGRAVQSARVTGEDSVGAILRVSGGRQLFRGKIVDVERRFRAGHDWGTVRAEGLEDDRGRCAELAFKNEYLILRVDDEVVLTVPDLITPVETETGEPLTTEVIRPGLRLSILGLRSTPLYHTPEALRVVGPHAFGYNVPFMPVR